jgi:hypothetical protein
MKPEHDLFNQVSRASLAEDVRRDWYPPIREAGSRMQRGSSGQVSQRDGRCVHRAQLLDEFAPVAQNFDNLSYEFEYLVL